MRCKSGKKAYFSSPVLITKNKPARFKSNQSIKRSDDWSSNFVSICAAQHRINQLQHYGVLAACHPPQTSRGWIFRAGHSACGLSSAQHKLTSSHKECRPTTSHDNNSDLPPAELRDEGSECSFSTETGWMWKNEDYLRFITHVPPPKK